MHVFRPRPAGVVDAIWATIICAVVPAAFAWFVVWCQGVLKATQHGALLSPFKRLVVDTPTWVLIVGSFALVFIVVWVILHIREWLAMARRHRNRRRQSSPPPTPQTEPVGGAAIHFGGAGSIKNVHFRNSFIGYGQGGTGVKFSGDGTREDIDFENTPIVDLSSAETKETDER